MASDSIVKPTQRLTISSEKYATSPKSTLKASIETTIIPRYLFRVHTPHSAGETTEEHVKSAAACKPLYSHVPILQGRDEEFATMLREHLQWESDRIIADDFVSWTSSIVFAIQYMLYRSTMSGSPSDYEDIKLFVLDTSSFDKGTFLHDLDVILAYKRFHREDFNSLHKLFTNCRTKHYYFGEYLTQGSLEIKDHCSVVSAQRMIDRGLFELGPDFLGVSGKDELAKPVVALRRELHAKTNTNAEASPVTPERVATAFKIAELFDPKQRLPMFANLLGTLPIMGVDEMVLNYLDKEGVDTAEFLDCSPDDVAIVTHNKMPEVENYKTLMRIMYRHGAMLMLGEMTRETYERQRKMAGVMKVFKPDSHPSNQLSSEQMTGLDNAYAGFMKQERQLPRLYLQLERGLRQCQ